MEAQLFDLRIVKDREGQLVGATAVVSTLVNFRESVCLRQFPIDKLKHIQNVRVYDLKGKRQSKLVWLELTPDACYSALLLITHQG